MVERGPVYRLIADDLRRRIQRGEYRPGQRLPSAHDLAEEVTRATNGAARALTALQRVKPTPGKGRGRSALQEFLASRAEAPE